MEAAGSDDFVPVSPSRMLDTRTSLGAAAAAPVGPGETIAVHIAGRGGIPTTGVGAIVLNVTGVLASTSTHVTVFPAGEPLPLASNLNLRRGQIRPNLVVVKLGAGGRVSFFNAGGTVDLVADAIGWFPAASSFQPLSPTRILDTRTGLGGPAAPLGNGGTIDLAVAGVATVPTSGVGAVVMNLTAVAGGPATYLSAWPTGEPRPTASSLNLPAGDTRPNLVVVKVGDLGKVSLYTHVGPTEVIADIVGWFPVGASFTPLTPARLLDTRSGLGAVAPGPVEEMDAIAFQVTGRGGVPSTGVGAVVLNVTSTESTGASYVTAFPTSRRRHCTSNLNIEPGLTDPNLVIVPVSPATGRVALYNFGGSTHLIADVAGWFPVGMPLPPGGEWCGDTFRIGVGDFTAVAQPSASADAGSIAIATPTRLDPQDLDGSADIYVLRDGQLPLLVSRSLHSLPLLTTGAASSPLITPDGRFVAFTSNDPDLVPGDTNRDYDAFLTDLTTGVTTLVSATPAGVTGAGISAATSISADGRYVAFGSAVPNLDGIERAWGLRGWIRDMSSGVSRPIAEGASSLEISADGTRAAFQTDVALIPSDTNQRADAYLADLASGTVTRLSVGPGGVQGTATGPSISDIVLGAPSLSRDGKVATFVANQRGLVVGDDDEVADAFVWREGTSQLERLPRIDRRAVVRVHVATDRPTTFTQLIGSFGNGSQGKTLEVHDQVTGQNGVAIAPQFTPAGDPMTVWGGRPDPTGGFVVGAMWADVLGVQVWG